MCCDSRCCFLPIVVVIVICGGGVESLLLVVVLPTSFLKSQYWLALIIDATVQQQNLDGGVMLKIELVVDVLVGSLLVVIVE